MSDSALDGQPEREDVALQQQAELRNNRMALVAPVYKDLLARHTALVEAVEIAIKLLREDMAGFDTIEDQNDYIRLRLDAALTAAQEET